MANIYRYEFQRWENYGKVRIYIKKQTAFKNRPLEDIGFIDLSSGDVIAARGWTSDGVVRLLGQMRWGDQIVTVEALKAYGRRPIPPAVRTVEV